MAEAKPFLFNERSTYVPLMMVVGVMATLVTGVYQVGRYISTQEYNETQASARFIELKAKLADIAVDQSKIQKEVAELKVEIIGFKSNEWNITDMLVWCREVEALNKGFRCPASMKRPKPGL
jgi:hypothetical protein